MIKIISSTGLYVAQIFGAICILIISFGLLKAVWLLLKQIIHQERKFDIIRLEFSLYLLLSLEFLIAKDIIESIINETWDDLGKLGVTIVLRIVLSYFISREVERIEDHSPLEHLYLKRKVIK